MKKMMNRKKVRKMIDEWLDKNLSTFSELKMSIAVYKKHNVDDEATDSYESKELFKLDAKIGE